MQIETTNLFLYQLSKEISFIEKGFIQKVQETPQKWIKFKVNTVKGTKTLVLTPKVFCLSEYKINAVQSPSTGFVAWMNKQLKNQQITKLFCSKKDRVIEIDFSDKKIVIELFGAGKILFLNKENIVLNSAGISKKARIQKGTEYKKKEYSDNKKLFLSKKELSAENITVLLARKGIPAIITENLKKRMKKSSEVIARKALELFNQKPGKTTYLYLFKKKQVLLPLKLEKEKILKKFDSPVTAANECFILPELNKKPEEKKTENKKIKALQVSIERQKQKLLELEKKAKKYKETGEKIYENYTEISKIIQKTRQTNPKIMYKKRFGVLKVVGVDLKEKKIKIEIEKKSN